MKQRLSAFPTMADQWIMSVLALTSAFVLVTIFYWVWQSPAPVFARILMGLSVTLIVLTVGSLPFSYNELTDEGLLLRQGWYFRAFIPYTNVGSVTIEPTTAGLWSPGIRRESDGKGLRVVLSRQNLIQLKLKNAQQFVVYGVIPLVKAERVLLNVPQPEETVKIMQARMGS